MIVFYSQELTNGTAILRNDEHLHCAKVLRRKEGDQCFVTDGEGNLFEGILQQISKKECSIDLKVKIKATAKGHARCIAIAPTKSNDRFEWFLEKATEIGITDIYPFIGKNSERKVIKPERLKKIIVSAMKQSKNFHLPQLHEIQSLDRLLNDDFEGKSKYIAHCMEPEKALGSLYKSGSDAIVLIGPEGDFTPDEIQMVKEKKWLEVSLGNSRLRTETAGIVACHLLNL